MQLTAERDGFAHVDRRHFLGRRDDDRTVQLSDELADRQRLVAGARRRVDDQVVQVPPDDVLEELLDHAHFQRAAPDDGIILGGQEEADGDTP